jgi:hypothetical protein
MKLAIMQPYFMPYIGYFSLISASDQFILFDTVQFIRHGWIERNRILKPGDGWQYIKVPLLKHSRATLINEVEINSLINWKTLIFRQLEHYKKKAPYYHEVCKLLLDCLFVSDASIVKLNARCLQKICEYIGLQFNYSIFSEMSLKIGVINNPGDWALRISEALNVSEYINPIGGATLFNSQKFSKSNITLKFLESNLKPYNQKRNTFEKGLSIIDVMMFNCKEEIQSLIDDYTIS